MALATRCPNCHALFRVVADQLKLRGGLVRCGACQHVFDAISTLSYIDDTLLSATPGSAAASSSEPVPTDEAAAQPTPTTIEAMGQELVGDMLLTPDAGPDEPTEAAAADAADLSDDAEPLWRSDVEEPAEHAAVEHDVGDVDRTAVQQAETEQGPEATPAAASDLPVSSSSDSDLTLEALTAEPRPGQDTRPAVDTGSDQDHAPESATAALEAEALPTLQPVEPAFLVEPSPMQRGFSIVFGGGAALLALALLAQLAVVFRAEILVRLPAARPALTQVCKVFGCTVNWPARGELLAVVGTELQALPGTSALELTAVVRNRAGFTLALPAIEVTLTDTQNRTIARKVFAPVDYLAGSNDASARILAGLEAGADLIIKIPFEARGLNAAGFVVYPFYL